MPVFDFNNAPEEKKEVVCTYTTFSSNEKTTSAEKPILVLDNKKRQWKHHSSGKFTNPTKATTFEFEEEDGTVTADILKIDSRFVSLLKWLGENHINVRLSGENTENGLQNKGNSSRGSYKAFSRRRIPSVYDRKTSCKQSSY